MCNLIRLAKGFSPGVFSLARPFSNFQFLEEHSQDLNTGRPALSRIFSQARRAKAQTLVLELLPTVAELEDEVQDLTSRIPCYHDGGAWRLSFFRSSFDNSGKISTIPDDDLIGYAIIRKDIFGNNSISHIFESIFSKYNHIHNFVPGQTEYSTRCCDRIFAVKGIMYCQQNAQNKACAQVALRSLLSSVFPNRPVFYSELNQVATVTKLGQGVSSFQIRIILDHFQVPYADLDYDTHEGKLLVKDAPYNRFIYAGMESGYGGLVGFEYSGESYPEGTEKIPRHIIPFFGHTFNQDTWAPRASNAYFKVGSKTRYVPSDEWLSSFIGHDDNFGSNFCIPRKFISPEQVKYALCLLPEKIVGTPLNAEARAIDFLYNHLDQIETEIAWGKRWKAHIKQQDTVARPLLMNRKQYLEHLNHVTDWEGNQEDQGIATLICNRILPTPFWMVELSLPDLYSANYSKIGEILFTLHPDNMQIDLAILRIPGQYAVKLPNQKNLLSIPSSLVSHVPLFTHERGMLDFDNTGSPITLKSQVCGM